MKNFIDIKDFTAEEITELLNLAIENKNQNTISEKILSGKNLILFFEKNSTRTRLSFDLAVKQQGETEEHHQWPVGISSCGKKRTNYTLRFQSVDQKHYHQKHHHEPNINSGAHLGRPVGLHA